jgi:hypothetical protein
VAAKITDALAANPRPRGRACAAKTRKFIVENPF